MDEEEEEEVVGAWLASDSMAALEDNVRRKCEEVECALLSIVATLTWLGHGFGFFTLSLYNFFYGLEFYFFKSVILL